MKNIWESLISGGGLFLWGFCESILRRAEGNEIVETVGVVAFVVKVQQVGELEVGVEAELVHLDHYRRQAPPAPVSRPCTCILQAPPAAPISHPCTYISPLNLHLYLDTQLET